MAHKLNVLNAIYEYLTKENGPPPSLGDTSQRMPWPQRFNGKKRWKARGKCRKGQGNPKY